VPDAFVFKRARDFVAWIGLTPRQFGTGGKQRSGGISKQGDRSLRTLFIVGACAHLRHEMRRGVSDPWLRRLLAERLFKVVAVAYAAKMARSSGPCWSAARPTGPRGGPPGGNAGRPERANPNCRRGGESHGLPMTEPTDRPSSATQLWSV
jgi:hypothetical protein